MMSRIPWIISGVLAVGLVASALDNRRLRATLTQNQLAQAAADAAPEVNSRGLHGSVSEPAAQRSSTPAAASSAVPSRSGDEQLDDNDRSGIASLVAERLDEAIEERINERRVERFAQMQDRATERVDDFADEIDLSDDDREAMHGILDVAMTDMSAIFESYSDVEDREEARESIRAEGMEVRSEVEAALVDLLGEEDAAAFQEEVRGPLGWQR